MYKNDEKVEQNLLKIGILWVDICL